jgi:hypothetical protein
MRVRLTSSRAVWREDGTVEQQDHGQILDLGDVEAMRLLAANQAEAVDIETAALRTPETPARPAQKLKGK